MHMMAAKCDERDEGAKRREPSRRSVIILAGWLLAVLFVGEADAAPAIFAAAARPRVGASDRGPLRNRLSAFALPTTFFPPAVGRVEKGKYSISNHRVRYFGTMALKAEGKGRSTGGDKMKSHPINKNKPPLPPKVSEHQDDIQFDRIPAMGLLDTVNKCHGSPWIVS